MPSLVGSEMCIRDSSNTMSCIQCEDNYVSVFNSNDVKMDFNFNTIKGKFEENSFFANECVSKNKIIKYQEKNNSEEEVFEENIFYESDDIINCGLAVRKEFNEDHFYYCLKCKPRTFGVILKYTYKDRNGNLIFIQGIGKCNLSNKISQGAAV